MKGIHLSLFDNGKLKLAFVDKYYQHLSGTKNYHIDRRQRLPTKDHGTELRYQSAWKSEAKELTARERHVLYLLD